MINSFLKNQDNKIANLDDAINNLEICLNIDNKLRNDF